MKVAIGFLLAPLAVPLYFVIFRFLYASYERNVPFAELGEIPWGFLISAGVYAYLATVILGMPSYLFLKSKDLLAWQVLTVLGGVLGALLVSVLLPVELDQILWIGLFPGALSGFVFWWMAVRE
ncbi:MAG: hypothetical protein JNN16_05335 [Nitrospira sp.]|nr:hypothetical protein [Nitrospira sp.]